MSIELSVLASGSTGNCSLVRTPPGLILLDAGIGPRTVAGRMSGLGAAVAEIRAICLTHLDHDHFTPTWINTVIDHDIPVFCPVDQLADIRAHARRAKKLDAFDRCIRPFDGDPFEPLPGVRCRTMRMAHDKQGSHAYRIDCASHRLAYATDVGRVPGKLIEFFRGCHILAIESNYDPDMQMESLRPQRLKRRIMGGSGHLSNAEAFAFVRAIFDNTLQQGRPDPLPAHVVLLHRSRQCNRPEIVTRLFSSDQRIACRLTLSHPFERTDWLKPVDRPALAWEQLRLF